MGAQAGHDRGGEGLAAGAAATLPVEDPGDGRVGVVHGEAAEQGDGVLVGADRRWRLSGQGDGELGQRPTTPAQRQLGALGLTLDADDHLVEQGAQQFLAVTVCGGGRVPHRRDVGTQREDRGFLLRGKGFRALRLAAARVRLRRRRGCAAPVPSRLPGRGRPAGCPGRRPGTAARPWWPDTGPVRPHGATAPGRRPRRVPTGRLRRGRRCSPAGASAARNAAVTAASMPTPPTRRCRVPRPSTSCPVPVQ